MAILEGCLVGAGMLFIIHFFKAIFSTLSYARWKKSGVLAKGVVGKLKRTSKVYKNRKKTKIDCVEYTYDFYVTHNQEEFLLDYILKSATEDSRELTGDSINILWNPKTKKYYDLNREKENIIASLKIEGIAAAVLIVGVLVVYAILG